MTFKLETTDLRKITRHSNLCLTVVYIQDDSDNSTRPRFTWITCGQSCLVTYRDHPDGRWVLKAYLSGGATDFEHDSAYAFRLPLVGVQFEGVDYQQTRLNAWVDPTLRSEFELTSFRVPRPGYNPMKHPDAVKCKDKRCGGKHIIVPEGFYAGAPFDSELYNHVKGRQVNILISPVVKNETD
jgi:hypothetical protein